MAGKANINGNNPNARTLDGKISCTAKAVGNRKIGSQLINNKSAVTLIGLLALLFFGDLTSFQVMKARPIKNKPAVAGSNNVLPGILKRS